MLEESVIYQDIFRKGEQRGEQSGFQTGGRHIALQQLERRCGKLTPSVRRQIERLALDELNALSLALLDFQSKQDLTRWLKQHAATH